MSRSKRDYSSLTDYSIYICLLVVEFSFDALLCLTLIMKILMQTILNVHTDCGFPTPDVEEQRNTDA